MVEIKSPTWNCPYHGEHGAVITFTEPNDGKRTVLCAYCIRDCLVANGVQDVTDRQVEGVINDSL